MVMFSDDFVEDMKATGKMIFRKKVNCTTVVLIEALLVGVVSGVVSFLCWRYVN